MGTHFGVSACLKATGGCPSESCPNFPCTYGTDEELNSVVDLLKYSGKVSNICFRRSIDTKTEQRAIKPRPYALEMKFPPDQLGNHSLTIVDKGKTVISFQHKNRIHPTNNGPQQSCRPRHNPFVCQ